MKLERTTGSHVVEHIKLRSTAGFDAVYKRLTTLLPELDSRLPEMLRNSNTEFISLERRTGPKLWLFHERDHGSLIRAEGRIAKAVQFDIGNPLTAESMTRHQLSAALYAPLRVLLYEDPVGRAVFEYDLPSSLFGQFGDSAVTAVGLELDSELESILRSAANP